MCLLKFWKKKPTAGSAFQGEGANGNAGKKKNKRGDLNSRTINIHMGGKDPNDEGCGREPILGKFRKL